MNKYADFANVYDILTKNIDYSAIIERITKLVPKELCKGGQILDLGCGTASLSLKLSKLGYDVIAVDASEEMLSVAREKTDDILYICQDLSCLDLYGTAKAAVCTMDTVNHIESTDKIKEFFKRLSLFLEMDSYFIFDMNTPYKHKKVLADNVFTYETDEVYCIWQNEYEKEEKRTHILLDFFVLNDDGCYDRSYDEFYEYEYDIETICNLLNDTGFDIEGIFDEYSDNQPTEESQRVSIIAKKSRLIDSGEIK